MEQVDYCENSIFLSHDQKSFINNKVGKFLTIINKLAAEYPIPLNIFLGGSLALREPSLAVNKNTPIHLMSDIDLFVFCREKEDLIKLSNFKNEIKSRVTTDISYSFHYLPIEALKLKIVSLAPLSVWEGREQPIRLAFPMPQIERPNLNPNIFMRVFISRLLRYILNVDISTHPGDEYIIPIEDNQKKYNLLKFLIAGLQAFNHRARSVYISDILTAAKKNRFAKLLSIDEISDLIYQREVYDATQPAPKVDLYRFVKVVLSEFSGTDDGNALNVLKNISNHEQHDIYSIVDLFLIAYSLCMLKRSTENHQVLNELLIELHRISKEQEARSALNNLINHMVDLQSSKNIEDACFHSYVGKLLFLRMKHVTNQAVL